MRRVPAIDEHIQHAAEALKQGLLVAFPTETVYGLGANALSVQAVRRIYALKGRPSNNPLIVHLTDPAKIGTVAAIDNAPHLQRRLSRLLPLWPGPLSLVLPRRLDVPAEVSGGGETVAVRIPDHPVAQVLIEKAGLPVAAPSANRSNYVSPTCASHVEECFPSGIAYILDDGPCSVGIESTVVSLTGNTVTLLRPGKYTKEDLEDALDEAVQECAVTEQPKHTPAQSPGLLSRHYSPRTPVKLLSAERLTECEGRLGIVRFSGQPMQLALPEHIEIHERTLSHTGDLETVARELFATLRELDKLQLNLILVDTCSREGIGAAIMDRLERASAK